MTTLYNTMSIYLLDYGAGNVRSLVNAVQHLGYDMQTIETAADFDKAEVFVAGLPGLPALR